MINKNIEDAIECELDRLCIGMFAVEAERYFRAFSRVAVVAYNEGATADILHKERCTSTHPEKGTKCGLPEGHFGQHANSYLCTPWD